MIDNKQLLRDNYPTNLPVTQLPRNSAPFNDLVLTKNPFVANGRIRESARNRVSLVKGDECISAGNFVDRHDRG